MGDSMQGKIYSINVSKSKGVLKTPVKKAKLVENHGVENDAHAGEEIKQVSFLSWESIQKQNECPKVKKGIGSLKPGDFAENITTEGIKLSDLRIGDRIIIGSDVILEISRIGKECHRYCSIYYKTGDCIMPREGIFAKVIKGGVIKIGDTIKKE
jgi:MOSC domain-containing protein YiiM